MHQQLLDYITQSRQAGKTDEQIQQELLSIGWPENEVSEVLAIKYIIEPESSLLRFAIIISSALLLAMGVYFASAYFLTLWPFEGIKSGIATDLSPSLARAVNKIHDDLGFIITIPENWKYQSLDPVETDVAAVFQYESPDSQKSFLITVFEDKDPEKITLSDWANSDALKYDSSTKGELSKSDGYFWTSYVGEIDGKIYKKVYLIRGIPKHIYRISAEMDKNNSWMPEFDQIVSSFQFFEPKTENYEVYKNIQFAFELTYPDTWRVREESGEIRLRNHYNPILDKPIEPKDFSIIYQKSENPEGLNSENWLLKNSFWTTYSKSKEYIKIGDKDAVKIYYEKPGLVVKDEIIKTYGYIIFRDKDIIHLNYTTEDGLTDSTIEKIIQSIKFIPFNSQEYIDNPQEYVGPLLEEKNKFIGEDKDNDGVWDYVKDYIKQKYPESEKVRAALYQYAKALQQALIDNKDKQKSVENAKKMTRASNCLTYAVSNGQEISESIQKAGDIRNDVRAEALNTKERSEAYITYNNQLGGATSVFSEDLKSECDFDLDKLAN